MVNTIPLHLPTYKYRNLPLSAEMLLTDVVIMINTLNNLFERSMSKAFFNLYTFRVVESCDSAEKVW